MDLNHRSPGYEPDGISRLPHLANLTPQVLRFQPTVTGDLVLKGGLMWEKSLGLPWAGIEVR